MHVITSLVNVIAMYVIILSNALAEFTKCASVRNLIQKLLSGHCSIEINNGLYNTIITEIITCAYITCKNVTQD